MAPLHPHRGPRGGELLLEHEHVVVLAERAPGGGAPVLMPSSSQHDSSLWKGGNAVVGTAFLPSGSFWGVRPLFRHDFEPLSILTRERFSPWLRVVRAEGDAKGSSWAGSSQVTVVTAHALMA